MQYDAQLKMLVFSTDGLCQQESRGGSDDARHGHLDRSLYQRLARHLALEISKEDQRQNGNRAGSIETVPAIFKNDIRKKGNRPAHQMRQRDRRSAT